MTVRGKSTAAETAARFLAFHARRAPYRRQQTEDVDYCDPSQRVHVTMARATMIEVHSCIVERIELNREAGLPIDGVTTVAERIVHNELIGKAKK